MCLGVHTFDRSSSVEQMSLKCEESIEKENTFTHAAFVALKANASAKTTTI